MTPDGLVSTTIETDDDRDVRVFGKRILPDNVAALRTLFEQWQRQLLGAVLRVNAANPA